MASSDFSGVTILLPKEAGLTELAEQINGAWQKDCSLFFSVEEVPQEEFDNALQRAVTPLRWLLSAPKAAAYTRCCSSSRPRAAA